jgi:hypothetical protein
MLLNSFVRSSHLSVTCKEAFQWHLREGALDRMLPPWMPSKIIAKKGSIQNGDTVTIKSLFGIIPIAFHFIKITLKINNLKMFKLKVLLHFLNTVISSK